MKPTMPGSQSVVTVVAALLVTMAAAGCYRPDIKDGGFICRPDKKCPDGFTCASDNRCWRNGMPKSDGGICQVPAPAPLCQSQPAAGAECDPVCQNGCACGRCNVSGAGVTCSSVPGPKLLGEVCALGAADNCGAGLVCLQESCGNLLGRCYRFCATEAQCNGTLCQAFVQDKDGNDTPYKFCDLAPQACDPVNNTGCPSPSLNCYVTSASQTLCDCPNDPANQGNIRDACTLYSDCKPGLVCVSNVGGLAGGHCWAVCEAGKSCQGGVPCVPLGTNGKYGYCTI